MFSYLLSFIIFIAPTIVQGQNSICGIYYNDKNHACKVNITNENFYYIESLPVWTNDTLADFEWRKVGNEFIEINSKCNIYEILGNIIKASKIIQTYDSSLNTDCIKFRIILPKTKPVVLNIYRGHSDENRLKDAHKEEIRFPEGAQLYSGNKFRESIDSILNGNTSAYYIDSLYSQECIYPKRMTYFNITIEPIQYPILHDTVGMYYGYDLFDIAFDKKLDSNANSVEIFNPFDYSYFEKYYTDGEFVRVHNDTLTWKGRTFVKSK